MAIGNILKALPLLTELTCQAGLFIRSEYREEILKSIRCCQAEKELELYGWCIPDSYRETSHVHLIIGTRGNPLQNIMRDLKRHTSEVLYKCIENNYGESRRDPIAIGWMLWIACPDPNREWKEQRRKMIMQ